MTEETYKRKQLIGGLLTGSGSESGGYGREQAGKALE